MAISGDLYYDIKAMYMEPDDDGRERFGFDCDRCGRHAMFYETADRTYVATLNRTIAEWALHQVTRHGAVV